MKYFRFFPDCKYISGYCKGALYDFTNSKTYSFSKIETKIINILLADSEVEEVIKEYGNVAEILIARLIKGSYGTFYEKPVYAETYFPYSWFNLGVNTMYASPPLLKVAYIQLDDECSANCKFCKDNSNYYWQGCNSCLRWPKGDKGGKLNKGEIKNTLIQLNDLHVDSLIFSGGNPLLSWSKVIKAIKFIRHINPHINVLINTNGSGFNCDVLMNALELNITFCFTVFADTSERYKTATSSDKLYYDLCDAIDECRKYNIPYSICLIVVPGLENNYIEIHDFAVNLGGVNFFTTEIFSKLEKAKRLISFPTGKERVENIPVTEYFSRYRNNTCLNGKIAISCSGTILPCPMLEYPLSQMPSSDLLTAFKSGKVDAIWLFTKRKVEICKSCEYRFACSDCSVLEWALFKNKTIHNIYCSYDSKRGKWT